MDGDESGGMPWFTHRRLVLKATGATIIGIIGGLWLMPAGLLPGLAACSALMCGTGFLAFVVKARRTYASAQLRYPPPLYRPSLLPYVLVFLALGLATWVALQSAQPKRPSYRAARSGFVVGDAAVNGVGAVHHSLVGGLVNAPGRALSGLMGVGFLFFIAFPILSAHAFGRLAGFSAGIAAARQPHDADEAQPQP